MVPAGQRPSPLHADQSLQFPLTQTRDCEPHLPQVLVAGPAHDAPSALEVTVEVEGWIATVAIDEPALQGEMSSESVAHAVVTTNFAVELALCFFACVQAPWPSRTALPSTAQSESNCQQALSLHSPRLPAGS